MNRVFLFLILFLSIITRFYNLSNYPAFNADEAALGYNAYSLIETGKDEHGNSWPIHFQSFNDYKPGLYVYIAMPFVYLLGLQEISVRLPGALLGVGTVIMIYLFVYELFRKQITSPATVDYKLIPLLSALLLAISPWHIHYSRGGWEVNVATFFIVTGLYFFIKGQRLRKNYLLSVLFFILALYTYHAARILIPLLGVVLCVLYWKEMFVAKKEVILAFIVGCILVVPLVLDLFGPAGLSRAAGVGLFADPGPLNRINELRGEHKNFESPVALLLHNKVINYGLAFMQNWAEHYEGEFLFLSGDIIERNRVPETGQTHLIFIVLFAAGIYRIARYISWKEILYLQKPHPESRTKALALIFLWFLLSPVAAALTFQSPHALRAQNMVVPFEIINALGLFTLIKWSTSTIRTRSLLYLFNCIVIFAFVLSFVRYQHMYWSHMSKEYPFSSQYGMKELVSYIDSRSREFQEVVVTDRYDQPYIMFLFYTKYDPEKFQSEHSLSSKDQYGFSTVRSFGKYSFWPIDFESVKRDYPNSLIAGTDQEIPKEANIVNEIYGSNGYKYFEIVAN